jgi:hypothetical protein
MPLTHCAALVRAAQYDNVRPLVAGAAGEPV